MLKLLTLFLWISIWQVGEANSNSTEMVTTLASVQLNSSSHSGILVSVTSSDKLLFSRSDSLSIFSLISSKISVTSSMILNATNQVKNVLATTFSSDTDRDSSITVTSFSAVVIHQSVAVNRVSSSSIQTFMTTKVSSIKGDLFTTHVMHSEVSTSTNLLKQNSIFINSLRPVNLSDINSSTNFKRTVMTSSVSPSFYTSKSLFSAMKTTIGTIASVLHISPEKHSSVFNLSTSLYQIVTSSMPSTETSFSYSSREVLKSHIQLSAFAISKQYLSIITKSTPGSSTGGNAAIEKSAVSKSKLLITTSSFKSRKISLHTNQLSSIFQTVDQILSTRNTITSHAAVTLLPKETEVSKRGSSVIWTISTSSFNQYRFSESIKSERNVSFLSSFLESSTLLLSQPITSQLSLLSLPLFLSSKPLLSFSTSPSVLLTSLSISPSVLRFWSAESSLDLLSSSDFQLQFRTLPSSLKSVLSELLSSRSSASSIEEKPSTISALVKVTFSSDSKVQQVIATSRLSQKETSLLISFQDSKSSSTQKTEMSAAVEPTRKSVPISFLTSTQSLVSLTVAVLRTDKKLVSVSPSTSTQSITSLTVAVPRSKNKTTSIPSSASAQSSASSTVAVPKSKNETMSITSSMLTLSSTDKKLASVSSSTSTQSITSSTLAVPRSESETASIPSSTLAQPVASTTVAVPKSKNKTTSIPSSTSTQSRTDKKLVSISSSTSTQSITSSTVAVPRSKSKTTSIPSSTLAQSSASTIFAVPNSKNKTTSIPSSVSTQSRTDKKLSSISSSTSTQSITSLTVAVPRSKSKTTSIPSSTLAQSVASTTVAVPNSKNETTSIPSSVSTQRRTDKKLPSISSSTSTQSITSSTVAVPRSKSKTTSIPSSTLTQSVASTTVAFPKSKNETTSTPSSASTQSSTSSTVAVVSQIYKLEMNLRVPLNESISSKQFQNNLEQKISNLYKLSLGSRKKRNAGNDYFVKILSAKRDNTENETVTIQFSISRNNQLIQASEASGNFAKLTYTQYKDELGYTVLTKPAEINASASSNDTLKTQLWVIVVAVTGPVILVLFLCNIVVCCKFRHSKNRKLWPQQAFDEDQQPEASKQKMNRVYHTDFKPAMPIEPIMTVRKAKQDFSKLSDSENEYEAIKTINNNIYEKKQNMSLKNVARKVMKKSSGSIDLLGDARQKSHFQTKENAAYLKETLAGKILDLTKSFRDFHVNPLDNNTGVRLNANVLAFLTKLNASKIDSPNNKSPRGDVSTSGNNGVVFDLEAEPNRVLLSPHEDKQAEFEMLQESPDTFNLLSKNDNTEEKEQFKGIDDNTVGTIYDEKPEEIEDILKEKVTIERIRNKDRMRRREKGKFQRKLKRSMIVPMADNSASPVITPSSTRTSTPHLTAVERKTSQDTKKSKRSPSRKKRSKGRNQLCSSTSACSTGQISTASDVDSRSDIEEISREEPLGKNLKDNKVTTTVHDINTTPGFLSYTHLGNPLHPLVPGFPSSMSPMSSIFHFPTLHGISSPRQPYALPEVHEIASRTTFDPRKNTVETPSTLNQDEGISLSPIPLILPNGRGKPRENVRSITENELHVLERAQERARTKMKNVLGKANMELMNQTVNL